MKTLQEKEDYLYYQALGNTVDFICYVRGIKNSDVKERHNIRENVKNHFLDGLNACRSPIERILYLSCLSMPDTICYEDIIPQYKIENYVVDIVWKKPEGGIVVFEADGHDFHEKTKEQATHDKERDRYMLANGIKVYRFTGSEIYNNTLDVLLEIQDILMNEFENLPE